MLHKIKKYFTYNYDKNIVELFKPLYILLSLTGLFPYTIRFPKGRHDAKIIRKPLVLHSLGAILMIAFLCLNFTQRIRIAMSTTTSSLVANITNIIELSLSLLCAVAIYFSAFRNANVYLEILGDIAYCWAKLTYTNVESIIKYLRRTFLLSAIVWLVVFSSVQITLCIIGIRKIYNQLIFETLPDAIPSLIIAFYSTMVLFIVGLLKNIEKHCHMFVGKEDRHRSQGSGQVCTENNVRVVYHSDGLRLSHLELAYVRALDIKQAIKDAFQAPISLITIQCFHGILSDAHTLYRELMITQRFEAHLLVEQCFWLVYSLAKVYALTYTGSLLKNEATNIGKTLHNIPTENRDNRLLLEVQHFSTLMSFRKPLITVYDYFSLDSSLLFSMIATVVTYLVILVQFDSA